MGAYSRRASRPACFWIFPGTQLESQEEESFVPIPAERHYPPVATSNSSTRGRIKIPRRDGVGGGSLFPLLSQTVHHLESRLASSAVLS